ncbi:DNA-directed RNA polymerase subunit beta [Paenibacillus glycanilyticus]|uniref:DNA-directed RNA polymerase subunit beta n=1 Tax=Paenibacillus glycanilyticus TaxID=126569 RepID=UPI00203CDB72|nr:DNA-directed RNA polymerase subunit beta [Paenibacillus glycanilyticus]MCM3628082.1 DNA-directed RNA polymerase subunit beta [Paenibacillus glycanilyticus]
MTDERAVLSRSAPKSQEKPPVEERSKAESGGQSEKKQRSKGARITFWILRKSIVPVIMVIMLITGLYVGYAVVGKQPGGEVFQWSTWQHMYDLVFSDT